MQFQRDERVERRRARQRQVRRRRMAALLIVVGILALAAVSTTSLFGPKKRGAAESTPAAVIELPRGGTEILPRYRVVAFYGAPGGDRLGILGRAGPSTVAELLADQASDYESLERPVLPAFQLIATIVHPFPGEDGLFRSRLPDEVIDRYLAAARQEKAILVLDIQPGRADFMDEVRHYRKYLEMPDVSLAIDPEWSMREGQIPGKVIGSTDAAVVNEVSAYLSKIVQDGKLPQKLFIVHEFTESMIQNKSAIVPRPGLATVLNADGFGTPEAKTAKYSALTAAPDRPASVFSGFKLFYEEDTRNGSRLMSPFETLDLEPSPDVVVYE